jgi:competence protein ComEA
LFGLSRREQYLAILLAVMVLVTGMLLSSKSFKNADLSEIVLNESMEAPSSQPDEQNKIKVHVIGGVNISGVYELPEGSRVIDAVQAAGGLTEDADLNSTNLAAPLNDGQQVKVFVLNEHNSVSNGLILSSYVSPGDGKINLNTATKEQLEKLTGIGPVLAGKIIEYRESKGSFKTISELKNVSGIGDKKFDQIKDEVVVY